MITSQLWFNPVFGLFLKNKFLEAIILLVGVIFVWAAFIRKPSDPNSHHHRKHHWRSSRHKHKKSEEESPASGGLLGGKRRRKRRKHRPANPTLAETGGLPPVRNLDSDSRSND